MTPTRLLAKFSHDPEHPNGAETLRGHTALVLRAARALLDARGSTSLHAMGLPEHAREKLKRVVLLGAFLHDVGKCSEHFQQMVRGLRQGRQLMRHEAVSLWLCWPGQPLADWTRRAVLDEREHLLALLAVAGHHRRFAAHAIAAADAGAGNSIRLFTGHSDFEGLLQLGAKDLGLGPPPRLADIEVRDARCGGPRDLLQRWQDDVDGEPLDTDDKRILAIAKALVLDADVAGSALPRVRGGPERWLANLLARRPTATTLEKLVAHRLGKKGLRPFQEAVAHSTAPVTLVTAGCGSGKTIAAWSWAARQHAGRQLWITYPTTGTATEGFRDYVHGADIHGRLEHGRARVDLEILGLAESDAARDRDRLDALHLWGAEAVTCTVDTVLGLLQNQRKGLYAWATLAGAAVVFDEIHAYDERLFGALLRFLDELPGIPVLLMTASLPSTRRAALQAVVQRRHDRPLVEIPGPADLENLPRYRLQEPSDDVQLLVRAALERGEKVLWVSNTVTRCVEAARSFDALVYHSRFRYVDRIDRHAHVIEAFRRSGPALATTTQVAEMSLDLSADLLITDLAPIPALIQRLGRLNRRSTPHAPLPVRPFVVLPFNGLPYETAHLDAAAEWLRTLAGRDLSQSDLARAWKEPTAELPTPAASAWLDGVFNTEPVEVREASPGITVLLPEDAARVRSGTFRAEEAALPMGPPPRGIDPWSWSREAYLPIVPSHLITYDPLRGAAWRSP